MIDPAVLEALAVAGCAALAVNLRQRSVSSAPRRPPAVPPARRLIGALPRRHRRAVRAIIDLAGDCLARHSAGSFEAFTADETLRTYLPETVLAFLSVPPGYRRARLPGRPSADDELRRQCDTLLAGLTRIAEADAAAGASRMAANGAFLDERFGPAPETRRRLTAAGALRREVTDGLALRFSEFIHR